MQSTSWFADVNINHKAPNRATFMEKMLNIRVARNLLISNELQKKENYIKRIMPGDATVSC